MRGQGERDVVGGVEVGERMMRGEECLGCWGMVAEKRGGCVLECLLSEAARYLFSGPEV